MAYTPYDDIPARQRWSHFAKQSEPAFYEASAGARFSIGRHEAIASAGSCFAGRLAEALRRSEQPYIVTESAPSWISAERAAAYGYLPFSARYGLVYSATQLAQLFDRAHGRFDPAERAWKRDGRFVDPFRPRTAPDGYGSERELEADRIGHFAAIRRALASCDVFFFTAGLTETWRDVRDGAVFPYCPGLAGGVFDAARYRFVNAGVAENVESLDYFVRSLRAVNPSVRVLLSVSPVPIGATLEPRDVASASTYSKSVLRVAVEEIVRAHAFVDYFPSYEYVSQSFYGLDPFTSDRRHLKPEIVERVVDLFRQTYLTESAYGSTSGQREDAAGEPPLPCDEDIFAR